MADFTKSSSIIKQVGQQSVKEAIEINESNLDDFITHYNSYGVTVISSAESKTANYSVTTSDKKKLIKLGSGASADYTFTLPSVGSGDDGAMFIFQNNSGYKLSVVPSDTDSVWCLSPGVGIELIDNGSSAVSRYDHATTTFDMVWCGGGRIWAEGLKLWLPGDRLHAVGSAVKTPDITQQHSFVSTNVGEQITTSFSGKTQAMVFSGSTSGYFTDHADFDIGNNKSNSYTVFLRADFSGAASGVEYLASQSAAATDRWFICRLGSGAIRFAFQSSGGTAIDLNSTTVVGTSPVDIAVCFVEDEVGLYIDGDLEAFANAWTIAAFAANLTLGEMGGSNFTGTMVDFVVCHSNLFNANPDVGLTDTITIPSKLNLAI